MSTTMNPTRTRTGRNGSRATGSPTARPRVRGSDRGGDAASNPREQQYDLLTAALVGLAIGAGATLLLRRGPSGQRPLLPAWRAARSGARVAGRGARAAFERGQELWDRIPRDEIEGTLRDYASTARDAIDHFVEHELRDLRKTIRRQRRKLGL